MNVKPYLLFVIIALTGCLATKSGQEYDNSAHANSAFLAEILEHQREYMDSHLDEEARLNYVNLFHNGSPWILQVVRQLEKMAPKFDFSKQQRLIVAEGVNPVSGKIVGVVIGDSTAFQFFVYTDEVEVLPIDSASTDTNLFINEDILRSIRIWDLQTIEKHTKDPFHSVLDGEYFIATRVEADPRAELESITFYEWVE